MSRKIWIGVAAILVALAIHDFAVPVQKAFGAHVALAAIDQYRAHVSPHLRGRVYCRFIPTCSAYGRESVRKYGLLVGGAKAVWRVARCNPWTPMGTYDPP